MGEVQPERAGLQPRHVQKVRDQAIETLGLLRDRVAELPAHLLVLRGILLKAAGRLLDHGEWRAQVVGHRAQQSAPKPLAFRREARLLDLGGELGAFQGRGDLPHVLRIGDREGSRRASC